MSYSMFTRRHYRAVAGLVRDAGYLDSESRSRLVSDFVEDYGRAAGHHTVSARHRADNQPVLALHRKRGCQLIVCRPTLLARLLRQPPMVISRRVLARPPGL